MYIIHQPTPDEVMLEHPYASSRNIENTGPTDPSADDGLPSTQSSNEIENDDTMDWNFESTADPDYSFDSENSFSSETDSDCSTDSNENETSQKFIVFESCLDDLFKFCKVCGSPVISKKKFCQGAMLGYKIECHSGHNYVWHSSPVENKQPLINIVATAAVVTTGNTYASIGGAMEAAQIKYISNSHFKVMQKKHVFPAIQEAWLNEQQQVQEELKNSSKLILSGDGRCDSPGYCAKFCTYTLMDASGCGKSGKIVDLELLQVSEVVIY